MSGVRAVAVGDDLVLLDLQRDRYLGVPGALCGATAAAREPGAQFDAELRSLLATAGLDAASAEASLGAPIPRPLQDLPQAALPPLRVADVGGVAGNLMAYAFAYRGASLLQLLLRAARERPRAPGEAGPGLWRAVRRLRRQLLLTPLPRKCLLQSFLLLRGLRREGYDAVWVIAVRVWPFAAHCWLQVGDVVVDDFVDRLDAYEPILAV